MKKLDMTSAETSATPYGWRLVRGRPTQYAVWMVKGRRRKPGPVFHRLDEALNYRRTHGPKRCDVLLPDNTWYSQLVRAQKAQARRKRRIAAAKKNAA